MFDDDADRPPGTDESTRSDAGSPGSGADFGGESPLPRESLGDFKLIRVIGRGGMGIVYEARQVSLNRRVALKVLPPNLGMTSQAARRFQREAQAAAKLHHTNIVPVHAIGEEEGHHFYAMDLIEGESLDRVLRELIDEGSHPLMEETVSRAVAGLSRTPGESGRAEGTGSQEGGASSISDTGAGGREWFDAVAKLIAEVASGLEYAHVKGIIHRDIKPANLMLSNDGRLCITDFGLARVAQEPSMTVSGSFLGTPAYMSPEQIAAGRAKLDHRTDIYSLGAVLYEMLALRRPFPGESREEIVTAIMTKDPRPPRRFNGKIPIDLETICLTAMEKDPDRRYRSAGEMAHDLQQYLHGGLITARRAGLPRRIFKSLRRHPVTTLGVAATVLLTAITGFAWQQSRQRTAESARGAVADARYYLSQGEYDKGLQHVDAALAAAPGMLDARLLRARLLMKLDRYAAAVDEAEGILADDPNDWAGHMILAMAAKADQAPEYDEDEHLEAVEKLAPKTAEAYYLRGLFADSAEAAIPLLDEALRLDPGHADALAERCRRHSDRKNFQAALLDGERLAALRPRSAQGRRMVADIHDELHDPARARAEYDAAIALDPDDPISYRSRGWHFSNQGRELEALEDMTRAIELDPENASNWAARGYIHVWLGNHEEAVADAEKALELDPNGEDAYQVLIYAYAQMDRPEERGAVVDQLRKVSSGWKDRERLASVVMQGARLAMDKGDREAAMAAADEVIELRPDWTSGYALRIWYRTILGDHAGVEEDCDHLETLAVTELNDMLRVANSLGNACNRPAKGIEAYSKVIDLAPRWADPYWWRSGLFWAEGRYEDALADYEKAIELAPRSGEIAADYADLLRAMERYEEALSEVDRSLSLGYDEPYVRCSRADALVRLGRAEEGLAVYARMIEERPNDSDGYECRGETYFELGRREEALEDTKRAISAAPGDRWAYWMLITQKLYATGKCDEVQGDLEKFRELTRGTGYLEAYESLLHSTLFVYFCPERADSVSALEYARHTREVLPRTYDIEGMALYRDARYEEAREALRESLGRAWLPAPATLFYLSMAEWKVGDKASARSTYAEAVERMDETLPDYPPYALLKDEASRLISAD